MGFHIALNLAIRGARVYIAARTTAAAEQVIARIEEVHESSRTAEHRCGVSKTAEELGDSTQLQLRALEVDLRSLSSAQKAAEMFLGDEKELHILSESGSSDLRIRGISQQRQSTMRQRAYIQTKKI